MLNHEHNVLGNYIALRDHLRREFWGLSREHAEIRHWYRILWVQKRR